MQIYEAMRVINFVMGIIFATTIVVLGIKNGQRKRWFLFALPTIVLLVSISALFLAGVLGIGDAITKTNLSALLYTMIECTLFWYAISMHR